MNRRPGLALLALLALGVAGCTRGTVGDPPVVRIGDEEFTRGDFDAYTALNLLQDPELNPESEDYQRVMSRLFDGFVEQKLLLAAAKEAGTVVGDHEIEFYVRQYAGEGQSVEAVDEIRPAWIVENLMVQKYRQAILDRPVRLDPAEVRRHLEAHRDELTPRAEVVLRSLQLESREQADAVYRDISRRKITFSEAVVLHRTDDEQGAPFRVDLESLPRQIRDAVVDEREGRTTPPVVLQDAVFLFHVQERIDPSEDPAELLELAREHLLEQERQQALEDEVDRLRRQATPQTFTANLPFRYVPEPRRSGPAG